MTSNKLIELEDLITIKDLVLILEVSEVTIHRWREEKGLHEITIAIPGDVRPAIRYSLKGLRKWAEETGTPTPGYKEWAKNRNGKAA